MYAAAGNCHVYVHSDADLEMAARRRRGRSQRARRSAINSGMLVC